MHRLEPVILLVVFIGVVIVRCTAKSLLLLSCFRSLYTKSPYLSHRHFEMLDNLSFFFFLLLYDWNLELDP